jgi:hypothetical protein
MANTFTPRTGRAGSLDTKQAFRVYGNLALSGVYAAGGESLAATFKAAGVKTANGTPYGLQAWSIAVAPSYSFAWDPATNKLVISLNSTGAELADGAYPAGLTTNGIEIVADFQKF